MPERFHENTKEDLAKQALLLKRAEEMAHIGYWQLDLETNDLIWSDQIYKIHGLDPEIYTPTVETGIQAYLPEDQILVAQYLEKAIREGTPFKFVLSIKRPTGEIRKVETHGECDFDENGEPKAIFGVFKDLTDTLEKEEKLKIAEQKALEASQAKTEFLARMSHELRTPLHGLIGFTDVLKETGLDDLQKHYVKLIQQSGRTLSRLVDDLLEFSKIESKKIAISNARFALQDVVDVCVALVKPEIENKGLNFQIDIAPSCPEKIVSDEYRLQQIILNLLTNAVEFTEDGIVTLKISCEDINDTLTLLQICISDTGIGIADNKKEEVFEAFQGTKHLTHRKFGGTGLGLSVVQNIVHAMDGEILFESQLGEGTTFTVKIPVGSRWPDYTELSTIEENTTNNISGKILIAEDIPINQELASAILSKKGHECHVVSTGTEAVEAVKNMDFDLILMDIQMPDMTGIEATEIIRISIDNTQLPIIALTAHALPEEIKSCFEAGMDDYIIKPVKADDLNEKVQYWLEGYDHDPFAVAHKKQNTTSNQILDISQLYTFMGFIGEDKVKSAYEAFKEDFQNRKKSLMDPKSSAEDICKELHAFASVSGNLGLMSLSSKSRMIMDILKEEEKPDTLNVHMDELMELYEKSIMTFEEELEKALED